MAEGHIVKGIEQAGVHAVYAAHRHLLALAAGGTGHELMGHQHAAVRRVRWAVAQHAGKGIVVGLHGLVRPDMPHHGGLEEGQKVHVQRAVFVGEGMGTGAPENTGLTYTRLFCSRAAPKAMRSAGRGCR